MEGNLSFKIDWASHIVGTKFTVFALFYFVFEGNFPSTIPRGVYIWRGLFSEFYVFLMLMSRERNEVRRRIESGVWVSSRLSTTIKHKAFDYHTELQKQHSNSR